MTRARELPRLAYTALESLKIERPVQRLDFIQGLVARGVVFDIGALDETALESKKGLGLWLHQRLCANAETVVGIDNSILVPPEGIATAPNGRILRGDIFDLSPFLKRFGRPDLMVAGEIIEHLPDTLSWLRILKAEPGLSGVTLVFSTPNACSWHNVLIGCFGKESTHPDHLQIYSYKTLRTLFDRSGLELQRLVPYHARFDEMLGASKGIKKAVILTFQWFVNMLERVSPGLSAGWIGIVKL